MYVCLLQLLSLRQISAEEGVLMLHPVMITSPSASKELYSKGQVWVWKREEANWLCGLLWDPGRSFQCYKASFLFQPFQPPPHSLVDFILFHRGLAVGRVSKASWRKGPLSSGLLWHDLWLQPQKLIVRLEALFHWVCLTGRKNCFVWWLYGKFWQKFCPAYWKRDISNRSSWTTLIYSGSCPLFVHRLSVSTNAFQFWRLNHCQ